MRLAEALVLRADCQRAMAQTKKRMERNVKVQEGDLPTEDSELLLKEYEERLEQWLGLVKKINKTNAVVEFDSTRTLAEALAERDALMAKRNMLNSLIEEASIKQDRYSRSEVKFFSTVNVPILQKKVDDLSKIYRELDFKIQEINWTTDLKA